MKTIRLLFITIIYLIAFSCKKDKLTGDNKLLIGTWITIPKTCGCCTFIGTPHDPLYKLELLERGKYKLYENGKKIEYGKLIIVNGYVTFDCSELTKSRFDGKRIETFNSDTLNIDIICKTDFVYTFIKKK
jgi:hypothetical protein